ncbi:MAG: glycosyltransferase [Gemmatimonadaceae bacterium]
MQTRGVEVIRLPMRRRAYVATFKRVSETLRSLGPSVVHTHGYQADILVSEAARRRGITTVTTVHGFTGGDWKNRLYERMQRRALRRFDGVVAVSVPLAACLAPDHVSPLRLHCIPNAYQADHQPVSRDDARQLLGIPHDSCRIGWVGRVTMEKGPDVAVRSLAALGDEGVHLSMIGDGAARPAIEKLATELGVGHRVVWHGAIPDAGRLLTAFDAFLLSSRTEGTPLVLLEAMAAGTPIIATRVGGVPHVVSETDAVLVASEAPYAIAAALRLVRGDPSSAMTRAASARHRLHRHFALEPWRARYDEAYRAATLFRHPK